MNKIKTEVTFIEKNGMNYSRRIERYENGQIASEGIFSKSLNDWSWSVPHGVYKTYYEDGTLKSEEIFDERGARSGTSCYFSKMGRLIRKLEYHEDRLVKEENFNTVENK